MLALALGVALAGGIAAGFYAIVRRTPPSTRLVRPEGSVEELYRDRAEFAEAWHKETAPPGRRHLPRFPIPERLGRQLFPLQNAMQLWDELTYIRRPPNTDFAFPFPEYPGGKVRFRTNSLGMRESAEPSATKPDLRVLVTGDSHTEGVCNNVESFPHVLRRALQQAHPGKTIECLNAGRGFFTFYSYLGILERYLDLAPDVFVVTVYAPNDFLEVVPLFRFFEGTPRKPGSAEYQDVLDRAIRKNAGWVSQCGASLKFFQHHAEEIPVAMRAAKAAVLDIQELCEAKGIRLVFVVLPGFFEVERRKASPDPGLLDLERELLGTLELGPIDADLHERMAKELMGYLAERKIPCLDAHRVFDARPERLYWLADHHINNTAHAALGAALMPVVEALEVPALR
jgi:hypothetical protein